jgi:N-acyl-D-aspartate/D-glutamate deacylase
MPVQVPMNMSFGTYCALNMLPDWGPILGLPVDERIAKLEEPQTRRFLEDRAHSDEAGVFARLTDFGNYVIGDTYSEANEGLKGRVVHDIAAERGADPFDTLVEIVVNDRLRTVLWPIPTDGDDASWQLRKELWEDPRAMIGGSDAGAHLDRMCGSSYTTRFVGDAIRGRQLVSMERAVQLMTSAPADLFGLRDRGRIAEGQHADIVVFDPETIGADHATLVNDLPGGSARLIADAQGVVRVYVNGVLAVEHNQPTGAIAGQVLRSGRDTDTVKTG